MAQADHIRDGRGIAIKLVDVDGPKLMGDEAHTQDFLFINHDVFAVKDASDYVELFRIIERDGVPTKFFLGLNPFKWHLKELVNANKIRVQVSNMLTLQYWTAFDFMVQLQTDTRRMPVEDPRVRWGPSMSPWRKLATLRIRRGASIHRPSCSSPSTCPTRPGTTCPSTSRSVA